MQDHVYRLLHIYAALQVLNTTDVSTCSMPCHNFLSTYGGSTGLCEWPQWLHLWEHKTAPAGNLQAESKIISCKSSCNRHFMLGLLCVPVQQQWNTWPSLSVHLFIMNQN